MTQLTEYGELIIGGYLDEWGRRRIDGVLEDGAKIITVIGGATYEIYVNAACHLLSTLAFESTYNIVKDAVAAGQAVYVPETLFNVLKDAAAHALSTATIELVTVIIEIFREAVAKVSASPQICGVYPINVDVATEASSLAGLQQTLNISRDAVIAIFSMPLIQGIFNLSPEATVKLLAEVTALKEGEFKVTRLFLIIGNLAIQLTGN